MYTYLMKAYLPISNVSLRSLKGSILIFLSLKMSIESVAQCKETEVEREANDHKMTEQPGLVIFGPLSALSQKSQAGILGKSHVGFLGC